MTRRSRQMRCCFAEDCRRRFDLFVHHLKLPLDWRGRVIQKPFQAKRRVFERTQRLAQVVYERSQNLFAFHYNSAIHSSNSAWGKLSIT
ncbi:MAG TPA: hypothetical protein VKT49_26655 [Bryobacteraceae bacterium]|nr:hypothetical protein [Bryobacteraceae bacterium]